MNEANYQALCKCCDGILRDKSLPDAVAAISFLHIVREHPVFLDQYEQLFRGSSLTGSKRTLAGFVAALLRCALQKPVGINSEKVSPADVLFVSHLVDPSHTEADEDFYYSDLPRRLSGLRASVALIGHAQSAHRRPAGEFLRGEVPTHLLRCHAGFAPALRDGFRLLSAASALRRRARGEPPGLRRSVMVSAASRCASAGSLRNMGIAAQVKNLLSRTGATCLVTTWEGHAWERVTMRAARTAGSVRCAGYQHAAVFKMQHAMRRSLGGAMDPDILLASGRIPLAQLGDSPALKGIPVVCLGSRRGRVKKVEPTAVTSSALARHSCLVLPEGIASECRILFRFSLAAARRLPDWDFIWRLHPVVAREKLCSLDSEFRSLPSNIRLSEATFEEDISASQVVLYRGTTAVVQAAMAGLLPIYINQPNEMSIDPLFSIKDKRLTASTTDDFTAIISADCPRSVVKSRLGDSSLQYALDGFFAPLDPQVLLDFLKQRR